MAKTWLSTRCFTAMSKYVCSRSSSSVVRICLARSSTVCWLKITEPTASSPQS